MFKHWFNQYCILVKRVVSATENSFFTSCLLTGCRAKQREKYAVLGKVDK